MSHLHVSPLWSCNPWAVPPDPAPNQQARFLTVFLLTWMARSTGPWQPLQQCWRVTKFLQEQSGSSSASLGLHGGLGGRRAET